MASGLEQKWRARHCTAISEDVLYIFGGCTHETKSLPKGPCDHDDDKKKSIASSVEIFDFMTSKNLKVSSTRGTPPLASMYLSYATVGRDIFCFAGSCRPDSCYHNSLMKLNINALAWREVIPSTDDGSAPLKKHGCGMIPFISEGRRYLLTLAGAGPTPVRVPESARPQYLPSPHKPTLCYTNEVHSTCISAPPGLASSKWEKHATSGDFFSPRAFFSAVALQGNRGILFGGQVIIDNHFERSDDVFIVSCCKDKIGFQKILKPAGEGHWPEKRYHHGATVITSVSRLNQETQHLVVLGGCNDRATADCWIMNISTASWSKIDLQDNITCRQKHSLTSYSLVANVVWIVVSGGYRKGSDPVAGHEYLMIVELVFKQDVSQWSVGRILNQSEVGSDRYHRLLFDCLVQGRRAQQLNERRVSISDLPSPGKDRDVAAFMYRIQEAEKYEQDLLQKVSELTQQLSNIQEKSDAEKRQILKEREEDMKGKKAEIKKLKQTIKNLKINYEENEEKHKSELGGKMEEKIKEIQLKNIEIEDLQQKLQNLQKDSASKLENTLKKHKQEMAERNDLLERIKKEVFRGDQEIFNVKETVKELQEKNQYLEKTVQQHEVERADTASVLERREEELSKKSHEVEDLKQRIKEQHEEREKLLKENNLLHENEIPKMLKEIEEKEKAMRDFKLKLEELQESLNKAKSELEENNEKLKASTVNPQWMVSKDEVEMTGEHIARGSYGEVSVAIFRGTRVAVKCLHNQIKSGYFLRVFNREMDISAKMHHPNIVQFIGAAVQGDIPVLLYELMETSLYEKMQRVRLDHQEILQVAVDVLSALAYLHAWKPDPIIHRDISSPNVLMEQCGNGKWRSKLSDFGSANLQRHTKTEWPGNPYYAAPEAQNPDLHTPKMDMYSIGILIMETVLNTPPPRTMTERTQEADSIQWDAIKTVVLRCIEMDHMQRPRSRELLDEMKCLQDQKK